MNSFSNAVVSREELTENGMKAFASSMSNNVDFFYKMGAMRQADPIPEFTRAYNENPELAIRSLQYLRDVRQGMGERKTFRSILNFLEIIDPDSAELIASRIPELGRFDDLFSFNTNRLKKFAMQVYANELCSGNQLAAKWAPRKGPHAEQLRKFLGWTPRAYRKFIVALTNVVENFMCANKWDDINYSHVPSVAHARYRSAFGRHSPEKYGEYIAKLKAGDKSVKINASAVFPHDVLKTVVNSNLLYFRSFEQFLGTLDKTTYDSIVEQWNALPNHVGDANIFPMIDVSGSMLQGNIPSPMLIAISLGLYLSEKNTGKFKDLVLTFSSKPEVVKLCGDVIQRAFQLQKSNWMMDTNIEAALKKILEIAVKGQVSSAEMPSALVIVSDMQFNACVDNSDESYMEMMTRMYEEAGYKIPSVVFWNMNGVKSNIPVRHTDKGTALISGYSPNVLKAVLTGNLAEISPEKIMLNAIMSPRYDLKI